MLCLGSKGIGSVISELYKLNGCVDPDSLNKAVVLLFGLALCNNTKDILTMILSI